MGPMRSALLMCLVVLACGCQATSFQNPPLADSGCDPALAGDWVSLDDAGTPNGELRLSLTAKCELNVAGTEVKQPDAGPTQVHLGRRGNTDYAWFNAAWSNHVFDVKEFEADPQDVYLFRYEVQGQELIMRAIDHKAVAHRIIDGGISGTVRSDENVLVNRVTGPARADILDYPDLFSKESSRFARAKAKL